MGSKSTELSKIIWISENDFPQKLPRIRRLRTSQLWQNFSLEVNNRSLSEKNSEFFSFEKNFYKVFPRTFIAASPILKKFSALVPKTSKISRNSQSFQDFLSKVLLRECFCGHVKSSFDNPAKNFPVKIEVFLVKVQKRRKTNCSRVSFRSLYSLHLDYYFNTPDYFFAKIRKKLTQSPKRDDISTNYCSHFFSKFCWGHFNEPYQRFFFAIKRLLSLRYRKRSNNYSLVFSPEKTLTSSAAPAPTLQF